MKAETPKIWAESGWIKFRAAYDLIVTPLFAEELKHKVFWKLRQWSPSDKLWMVDPSVLDDLIEIARKHFPDVVVMNGGSKTSTRGQGAVQDPLEDGAYGTVANLLRAASTASLKRIYLVLAGDLHPDRGGDGDTMRRLNTAWDKIRSERGVR